MAMSSERLADFYELKSKVEAAGLFRRAYGHYLLTGGIALMIVALSLAVVVMFPHLFWLQALNAFVFAFFSAQIGIIGHDLSHGMVFASPRLNRFFASLAWSVVGGLSELRWYRMHNEHHKAPNHIGHDPDLRIPFTFSTAQRTADLPPTFENTFRRMILPVQHLIFFPALAFVYMNYIRMAFMYNIGERSWRGMLEIAIVLLHFVAFFWFVFAFLPLATALVFIVVTFGLLGFYMSILFAPNHKGCPEVKTDEPFTWDKQILNTRNIRHTPVVRYVMGGLDYQIEHHLFPTMARACQPEASKIVRVFCAERNIPYHEVSMFESFGAMYDALKEQALAAR